MSVFERKMDEQMKQQMKKLDALEDEAHRRGSLIRDVIAAEPHERIRDPVSLNS